jgi:hypothetical protein
VDAAPTIPVDPIPSVSVAPIISTPIPVIDTGTSIDPSAPGTSIDTSAPVVTSIAPIDDTVDVADAGDIGGDFGGGDFG